MTHPGSGLVHRWSVTGSTLRVAPGILWPLPAYLTMSLNPSDQIRLNMTVLVCILSHNETFLDFEGPGTIDPLEPSESLLDTVTRNKIVKTWIV